ncbi:DUF2799 domain-containing protein [Vibrio aphrogenes]|uniref:DUF2799 domain-containing protein n=1 Tax=Vibrio aphrogenes TaxID=1891186 RepID=UPI000B350BE4|nr:DUF2799 domain-containing protein [Vibrio aphrogenes]
MRINIVLLTLLLSVGCVSQQGLPDTANTQDWQAYGEQMAAKGFVEHSQEQLAKQSTLLTDSAYQAYQQGYEKGLKQFCSQNASWLGATGQPYRGTCDNLDPFFREDYMSGLESQSAGK